MTDAEAYQLGWEAASHGEKREWCEQRGSACVRGWEAFWDALAPPEN